MKPISRREALALAAVSPLLSADGRSALETSSADSTETPHEPPYAALQRFIAPGNDEFAGERLAAERREALHRAFAARSLPIILEPGSVVDRAEFYVLPEDRVRFEIKTHSPAGMRYQTGVLQLSWNGSSIGRVTVVEQHTAAAAEPLFREVTGHALGSTEAFREQLRYGVPYWRARLDPATGIDVYGSNGVAVGDIDNDGTDEIYVCQPGGLPNRLFKVRADGSCIDISETWGVALLDSTSCALFLDLRNTGRQDLVVLRDSGPVLFLNEGNRYRLRTDAFQFEAAPKGGFTGMAAADFDRDGKLDLYLCCYVYFQSEAQYTYAAPYHDAQNGPPNFLFRNRLEASGEGVFVDCTAETGLSENNNRFSFAPAWCDYNGDGWPDLYVANDFGRKNLYRNTEGHFRDVAHESGVEDIGPGMSASWFDYDGDGRPDLYVANMWTAAGQRVTADHAFAPALAQPEAYRAHTMGNSLYRNRGDGRFENVTAQYGAGFGRWAWAAGGHDFDLDGKPEIFVTCGMLTNRSENDLDGFFWRQVVARSPLQAEPSAAYENGWNAINQFLREDWSWNGHEPNVLHVWRDGRYQDFSGVSGLDLAEDSRAFAVTDLDGDGRPDLVLKSRLGPQVRLLQNNCAGDRHAVGIRLRGVRSNRDAIGAKVEADGQTKWLEAGSGFLSQHSKQLLFGVGENDRVKRLRITWPSGAAEEFHDLAAGYVYSAVERSNSLAQQAFRVRQRWPSSTIQGDNREVLHDTWFRDPLPLPKPEKGPGLFVLQNPTPAYKVFRRYLFDWRAPLEVPMALLLNAKGEAVKVYASVPDQSTVAADLRARAPGVASLPGFYIQLPHRDYFKFGAGFLLTGMPREALPYLQRILDTSPGNARVLALAGQIELDLDRTAEASRHFEQALVIDGRNAPSANGLGLALSKQGKLSEAQRWFERAIELRRDYPDAINNLGVLFAKQNKFDDAIAAWKYGLNVAPDEDILYLNLGRTYVQLGQRERAKLAMQALLDRKPGNEMALRNLQLLNERSEAQ